MRQKLLSVRYDTQTQFDKIIKPTCNSLVIRLFNLNYWNANIGTLYLELKQFFYSLLLIFNGHISTTLFLFLWWEEQILQC